MSRHADYDARDGSQHVFVGGIEVSSDDSPSGPWQLHNAAVQDWLTMDGGD